MEGNILKYKENSLALCRKLMQKLNENDDDANLFFGGELQYSYQNITDLAKVRVKNIQIKIENL